MARPIRTIDVYANPYAGIDHDGVPQGVMQMPGSHAFIGAVRDLIASAETGKTRIVFTPPNTAKGDKGVHGLRKFTVPFTAEIARAVLEGGLIVADKEHARMVGLSSDDYVEPEKQLEAERERALKERQAQLGPDATIADVPTKLTELPSAEDATAPKAAGVRSGLVRTTLPPAPTPHSLMTGATPLAGPRNDPAIGLRKPEES